MNKQILSEEFRRMQKLAGLVNEAIETPKEIDRLYRQISNAPSEITIEITEIGKNLIKKVFGEILEKSRPDIFNNSNWLPPYDIDLVDNITLEKKIKSEITSNEKPKKIGSMKIIYNPLNRYSIDKWIEHSPMFKSNKGNVTDIFNMYAFYIPFVDYLQGYDTTEKAAMILINAGVDFNNSKQIDNFTPLDKGSDYFDKFEVGQVSDKGYFKILKIN